MPEAQLTITGKTNDPNLRMLRFDTATDPVFDLRDQADTAEFLAIMPTGHLRIGTTVIEGRINLLTVGATTPAVRFVPGSTATEVLWSTGANGSALWRQRQDSASATVDLYLERHDGTTLHTLLKADRQNHRLGIFGDYNTTDQNVGIVIRQGRTDAQRGLVVNNASGSNADYDSFSVLSPGSGTSRLLWADPSQESVVVHGTKPEQSRLNVKAKSNVDHATIHAEAVAGTAVHLFLFTGIGHPSGAGNYGWRFEEENSSDGNFRLASLVNGTQTRVLHVERATGDHRIVFRLKVGADSSPNYQLDVAGSGGFSSHVDLVGISTPSNPAAGTRRLFTNSSTGELSVRTSGGATISLETDGMPTGARKAADQTFSSTTLADVSALSFSLTAGRYYYFRFVVLFRSDTAAVGIRLSVTIPTVNAFGGRVCVPAGPADATNYELQGAITASDDAVIGTEVQAINTDYIAIVEGTIAPSANGTLQLRAANETGTTTVTVRQGSVGLLYDLGT